MLLRSTSASSPWAPTPPGSRSNTAGWERLGAAGEERRARNLAGWEALLPHFQAAVARRRRLMAKGTKEDPWALKTPPGTSGYTIYKDEQAEPPALICQVGSTTLKYYAAGYRGPARLAGRAR